MPSLDADTTTLSTSTSTTTTMTTSPTSSSSTSDFEHRPGDPFECIAIPVEISKVPLFDENGNVKLDENGKHAFYCGFSIGGGIDQDHRLSPNKYPDNGVYVTSIKENGPAAKSNLRVHDKILQVNGYDFTMITHKQAVEHVKKGKNLYILVSRKEDDVPK